MPHVFVAGKSAGLILRHIRAPVLQEARAIQLQQLIAAAALWSLRDDVDAATLPPATLPPPDRAAPKRWDPHRAPSQSACMLGFMLQCCWKGSLKSYIYILLNDSGMLSTPTKLTRDSERPAGLQGGQWTGSDMWRRSAALCWATASHALRVRRAAAAAAAPPPQR